MAPHYGHGKICYLEIPTQELARSIAFYQDVFGWKTRTRGDGSTAFDDAVGEVSGTWVKGRAPAAEVGLLVYIMVNDAADTVARVQAAGGTIIQPIGADAPEITARFRDPSGNIFGIYQQPA